MLVKIAYYRGVVLPLIGDFEIGVDGEKFGAHRMKNTEGRHTFTLNETAQAENIKWEFGKLLTITVLKPGGVSPGFTKCTSCRT